MQLTVTIPDEFDQRVLDAFGSAALIEGSLIPGDWVAATPEAVAEQLALYCQDKTYQHENRKAALALQNTRSDETWTTPPPTAA